MVNEPDLDTNGIAGRLVDQQDLLGGNRATFKASMRTKANSVASFLSGTCIVANSSIDQMAQRAISVTRFAVLGFPWPVTSTRFVIGCPRALLHNLPRFKSLSIAGFG